jgi:hypothetical protein
MKFNHTMKFWKIVVMQRLNQEGTLRKINLVCTKDRL